MQFSDLSQYDYTLPPELIRKKPLEPRDSARLFVYDTQTDTITLDIFRNVAQYLPERSLLLLNDTKVLPARLWLKKETGGKIEVLVLANEIERLDHIPIIVDRKVGIGQKLFFPDGSFFEVLAQEENVFRVRLEGEESLFALLDRYGTTPIPHYLEGEGGPDETRLRERYQTIFAASGASVAAPTASLHFTDEVFQSLLEKKIAKTTITLNVGLGTFAPLTKESFITQKLHTEYVDVSREAVQALTQARERGESIVAVGTTVTRTLEALGQTGTFRPYAGSLNTFIFPPYHFQMVDVLLTNFHLPETSLMLLVDAFLQHKKAKRRVSELYQRAIQEKFSFYSFGDSMLIL